MIIMLKYILWLLCVQVCTCNLENGVYNSFPDVVVFEKEKFVELQDSIQLKETQYTATYPVNDIDGIARQFDGIGGLSGGGATSRLLVNYDEPYRNQILDYLFKPNFGASLHILKVEIGGDAQSTEGTESSHMHNENDENYTRGYEWWLMKEAKKRNPNIQFVGLPWGWPGWIGQGTVTPYKNRTLTALYIIKWIQGAKEHHGLDINYVGIWNERPFDAEYIKTLRSMLDAKGFRDIGIIASDAQFLPISEAILKDPALSDAVKVIGAHYPGTVSGEIPQKTKKILWASEDYSRYNDAVGAGCWARTLNQNYVNGNITSTISWNLIASYYDHLPFKRCSLMTANEPWSGHYELAFPLWITAHTTQFVMPGWHYLKTVGHLQHGGSYVALTDNMGNLTIIIETLSHDQSACITPIPSYTVSDQNAMFTLGGQFKGSITKLNKWQTRLGQEAKESNMFINKGQLPVDEEGNINLFLPVDTVVTLSTIQTATKGSYANSPASASFPLPYVESFDATPFSEASNFADQSGTFETFHNSSSTDGHEWTMRQVVTQRPVTWCNDPDLGFTVIGDYAWSAVSVSVQFKLESTYGVFVALRVDQGGCVAREAKGLFLWFMNGSWILTSDIARGHKLQSCMADWKCWVAEVHPTDWNVVVLTVNKIGTASAYLNGKLILEHEIKKSDDVPNNGWAALGTANFGTAQFDNFAVKPV